MENSIKAVYIAAGVLIGVLILTTFVLVFRKGGQFLETIDGIKTTEAIAQYNSDFVYYNREDNNIFDIITACNKAYDINHENMFDAENGVNIEVIINADNEYKFERNGKIKIKMTGKPDVEKNLVEIVDQKKLIDLITQKMADLTIDGELISTTLSTITVEDSTEGRIHKYLYTFTGKLEYDNFGKINKIEFKLNTP